MQILWIFIGGGLGSISRYAISVGSGKVFQGNFPLGTFISNFLACLILGLTIYGLKDKINVQPWISPLLITGFCGGFSTFSTWSRETLELMQQGHISWAIANILISIAATIGLLYWLRTI